MVVHIKSLLHSDGCISYVTKEDEVSPMICHSANQQDYLVLIAFEWATLISRTFKNLEIKGVKFNEDTFNQYTSFKKIKKLLFDNRLVYISLIGQMRPIVNRNFNKVEDDISELYSLKPDHCHNLTACRQLSIALVMALQLNEMKLPVNYRTPANPKSRRVAKYVERMLKQNNFKDWKKVMKGNQSFDCSELEIGECMVSKEDIVDIDLEEGSIPNKPFLVTKKLRERPTEMIQSQSKGYNSFTVESINSAN